MKVLLYTEGLKVVGKSGLGKAINHQKKALESVGIPYTTKLNDDYDDDFSDEEDEEEDYSYKKELSSDLIVGPLNINTYVVPGVNYTDTVNNALLFIKLPAYTNYSSEDYGLNLVIPYNTNKVNIEIKTPTE